MINPLVVTACENFSSGKIELAMQFLQENIVCTLIGLESINGNDVLQITGRDEVKNFFDQGTSDLINKNTMQDEKHVIVEGEGECADASGKIFRCMYCDVYTIENDKVSLLRSYGSLKPKLN